MTRPTTYGDIRPALLARLARKSGTALTMDKMRRASQAIRGRSIVAQIRDDQRGLNDLFHYGLSAAIDGRRIDPFALFNRRPDPMIINIRIREISNGLLLEFGDDRDWIGAPEAPGPVFYPDYPTLYAELPAKISEQHERLTAVRAEYGRAEAEGHDYTAGDSISAQMEEAHRTLGEEEQAPFEPFPADTSDYGAEMCPERAPEEAEDEDAAEYIPPVETPGYVIGGDSLHEEMQREEQEAERPG